MGILREVRKVRKMKEFIFPWGTIKVPFDKDKTYQTIWGGDATSARDLGSVDRFDGTLLSEAKTCFVENPELFYIAIVHPQQFIDLDNSLAWFSPVAQLNKMLTYVIPSQQINFLKLLTTEQEHGNPHQQMRIGDMSVLAFNNILVYAHFDISINKRMGSEGNICGAEALFMGSSRHKLIVLATAI